MLGPDPPIAPSSPRRPIYTAWIVPSRGGSGRRHEEGGGDPVMGRGDSMGWEIKKGGGSRCRTSGAKFEARSVSCAQD